MLTAYVRKFVSLLSRRVKHSETVVQTSTFIAATEVKDAEELWIQSVRSESFELELAYCQTNGKRESPIRVNQFGLFIDEHGLL